MPLGIIHIAVLLYTQNNIVIPSDRLGFSINLLSIHLRCCCYLRLHRHSDVTLITIRSKKRRKKEMNVVRKINHVSYCIYYYYYPHKSNEIMTLWKITSRGLFHSATKTKIKEMSECWQLLCSAKISRMKFDLYECSYFTNYIHIASTIIITHTKIMRLWRYIQNMTIIFSIFTLNYIFQKLTNGQEKIIYPTLRLQHCFTNIWHIGIWDNRLDYRQYHIYKIHFRKFSFDTD